MSQVPIDEAINRYLTTLEQKVARLAQLQSALLAENEALRERLAEQQGLIERQRKQVQQTKQETKVGNLTSAFMGMPDLNHQLQRKVDELIAEIDRCLAQAGEA